MLDYCDYLLNTKWILIYLYSVAAGYLNVKAYFNPMVHVLKTVLYLCNQHATIETFVIEIFMNG